MLAFQYERQAPVDAQGGLCRPTRGNIRFSDIGASIAALGGEVRQGAGSRVVFELKGKRVYLHRSHPGHEAKKYQVEEVREFLRSLEIPL